MFLDGVWKTVCDLHWMLSDARVVCRHLGFTTAVLNYSNAFFGKGSGLIGMDTVFCTGDETSISDCLEGSYEIEEECTKIYGSVPGVRVRRWVGLDCETKLERVATCNSDGNVGVLCGGTKQVTLF